VDALFLSNLDEDHREREDLAAKNPEIVAELTALHEAWLAEVEAAQP
jgi:hypothetical protein